MQDGQGGALKRVRTKAEERDKHDSRPNTVFGCQGKGEGDTNRAVARSHNDLNTPGIRSGVYVASAYPCAREQAIPRPGAAGLLGSPEERCPTFRLPHT